jgi:hypothetical protein
MNISKSQSEIVSAPAKFANGVGTFLLGAAAALCLTGAKLVAGGAPVNLRSAASFAGLVGAAVFLAHGLGHLTGILGFRQALWSLGFCQQQVNLAIQVSDTVARHPKASLAVGYKGAAGTKGRLEVLSTAGQRIKRPRFREVARA